MPGGSAGRLPGPCVRENLNRGFHHVALATRDAAATHTFYTEVMGCELVKVHVGPTPGSGRDDHQGFSKHFFYATNTDPDATGGRGTSKDLIAFWEITAPA